MNDFRNFKFSSNIAHITPKCQGEFSSFRIEDYLSALSKNQQAIAQYILKFQRANTIKLKNQTIATVVGCSIKTVTRATNKFKQDGFILKAQNNRYTPNNFFLSPTAKNTRRIYPHSLNSEIHTTRNVPQNNINKLYLYNKPIPIVRARARILAIDGDGFGFLSKKERERKERVLKGIQMLNQEQKEWVVKHGKDPRVKEYVMGPKVKPLLITPIMESATSLLGLDEREQLKLVAYPEEALRHAYDAALMIVEGKIKAKPIQDRMGWFIFMANDFCKKNSLTVDWKWYFDIAQILGIEATRTGEAPKPLVVKNQSEPIQSPRKGIYAPHVSKPKDSPEKQLETLKKELLDYENYVIDNTGKFSPLSFQYPLLECAQKMADKTRIQIKELEMQIEVHKTDDILAGMTKSPI